MNYQQSMRQLAQAQNDALVGVRFYIDAIENLAKSKEAGRPIFDNIEMVEVKFAGDKTRIHVAPALQEFIRNKQTNEWESYAEHYAPIYERFKAGEAEQGSGTPLKEAPFLTAAQRSELKALNIKTIEALAALDGGPLRTLGMGGRDLKNQAQAYMDNASGSADVVKFAKENDALKARLAEMEDQMKELLAANRKKAATPEPEDDEASPFDEFTDEDIRNWLEQGEFEADKRWSRKTLLKKANEANAELAERKKNA